MRQTLKCVECVLESLGTAQAILQRVMGRQTDPYQIWVAVGHVNTAVYAILDEPSEQADALVARLVDLKNAILRTPRTVPGFDALMAEVTAVAAGADISDGPPSAKPKKKERKGHHVEGHENQRRTR